MRLSPSGPWAIILTFRNDIKTRFVYGRSNRLGEGNRFSVFGCDARSADRRRDDQNCFGIIGHKRLAPHFRYNNAASDWRRDANMNA